MPMESTLIRDQHGNTLKAQESWIGSSAARKPANHSYTEVSGVPASVAVGDVVSVGLVRYENEAVLKSDTLEATVLKVEDGDVWMRTENRVGFIINVK